MELYLSACSKAASVAATKTATSSLEADSQKCGDGAHKTHFPGVGASQLLDLPLGVKLPMIPGSNTLYYTTKLSEQLFRPSYSFNLTDPYCRLMENEYKSLHDPHLRAYYKRKDILRRLKKGGYITSDNKVVCNLRELNKYRQYLTSLKLDFERNYIKEQKMLAKQVNRLQEDSQIPGHSDVTQFQNWLLQEDTQSVKDQERLIRHRYLDMISRELEQRERTAEEQHLLQMDREERRQREDIRRKLCLRRKIEEEWKTKEMLLLTKIGEDVKREARIEEQRRRSREESDRKKQALLEKKMAYHLQKMQENGFKREEMGKNTFDYRGQGGTHCETASPKKKKKVHDDKKIIYPVGDQKTHKGGHESAANAIHQCLSSSKNAKNSAPSVFQSDARHNNTEEKQYGVINKKSSTGNDRGAMYISAKDSIISAHTSPTRNIPRSSQSHLGPTKHEKEINAVWSERQNKRSHYICESGLQAPATAQGIFPSHIFSNTQQNLLQNCLQKKVTSEELNSIIQNIMTWVVATVTSTLYPAITKYEERLQNNTYTVSDESVLSSDSSSFCSTCSEEFTYRSYTSATTKTFQREPCAFAVDRSVRRPTSPLKPPSAHVGRAVGNTYHIKGQSITSGLKKNKTSMIYAYPKLRSCKSDSHLLASFETGTKKSKDATTETDGLQSVEFSDKKAKAISEIKNLKNIFVNFKCHLKAETELILERIFEEITSDLTQAIPSISSVTAEVFVDQSKPDKTVLLSNADISSVASEIVENMLKKLQSAVEKKCFEMFLQEDLSVDIKPSLTPSGEYLTPSNGKPLEASLPSLRMKPMCDIAEDMVHAILQKFMTLASCKQDELPHLGEPTKLSYQQHMTNQTCTFLKKADKKKCSLETDEANVTHKEEIQNLISNICSQSSLVGYIEEAVSAILGYIHTELNSERLIASEETVVLLQLLNDIFTQLHQKPLQADGKKCRRSRLSNFSDPEGKYRITGTRLPSGPRSRKPFPPINVPGMVLYSEDDNEQIDKIVENALDSSFKEEKAKSQKQNPEDWFTKGKTCFEYKRNSKPPTKPASPRSKVAFYDGGLNTELPCFNNQDILKEKPCLKEDVMIFSQDQKHKMQKASQNIVKSILTEMFKGISSIPPGHLGSKTGKEASGLVSEKPQGLSHQEWMEQMFSASEIHTVAQEITDAVLNILLKASSCMPSITKSPSSSSVHQTSLDTSDIPHMAKEAPNKKSLKIWFDSEKKMKYLSSLDLPPTKPSLLKSEESELKPIDDLTDKIINTVFKRLKLLIYPKLQIGSKSPLAEQSSLQSQLSTYTTKVVNIVLHAIQDELELDKKNHTKSPEGFFADTDKLESLVSSLDDDIMTSPLLTCICEILSSGHPDQSSISLPSDKSRPSASYGSDNGGKQNTLPNRQDKKSFHQYLATPCALHSVCNGKDLTEKMRLQIVDRIGETLSEMLLKLLGAHPDCQRSCSKLNRKTKNENQQRATELQSNIQLVSKTILEYILTKLCNIDMDTSFTSSGIKAVSEAPDIDSLSFASIIEEIAKCTDIISSIVSRMMGQKSNEEGSKTKVKTTAPVSSKTGRTKEIQSNKLKSVASDILNMVFAKLEGFANGNLETLDSISDGNKNSSKMDLKWESANVFTDTHEELLQSTLYKHAKKVSSSILKAIQTELNMNSDMKTSIKTPPRENQMLTNIVNLILEAISQGANKIIPKFSVPKSDAILISNDIVDIVLHNLRSAVMLGINTEDPTSARLPLTFCDMFSQAVCQRPPLMESKSERKTECFPSSKNLKSAYADDSQITVVEKEYTKKSAPDPFEENANFITKTIFNRLESFATERIDSLITLAFQPKEKLFVCPELENHQQDDSIFHESSQMQSNVRVLKIPTENILSQEPTGYTFASYRGKLGSTIHLSQTSLKEYADIIASVVLKLIKNDIDLEIQKVYPYQNNILFQENIIVSETVNSILKILCDKKSVKEISFYSEDIPNSFSQLTVSNEILPGQIEQEENTKVSLFSKNPLEQNQTTPEKESQRIVLEDIFMRNGESKQKRKTALLSAVEEVLNKVYQRIMEIIGHLPPFNEIPYFVYNSKIKTPDITQKNFLQSHINNVANDIVESVLEKMYSVVVTCLCESNNKDEASDNNDTLPKKPSFLSARETKQAGKRSTSSRYVIPQVYPYADKKNVSLLENNVLQYSSLQVAKDLVELVLSKITNFASFHLEETSSAEGCSDELQSLRLHRFKDSPKGSPQPGFKTSLKARSKVTPLPKFRTKSYLGPSGAKAKSKTKLNPVEKTPKDSQSKTASELPHILSTGDAQVLLETKLPPSELKIYAKDVVSNILETIVKEFEKVKQTRAMVKVKALPSDQIMAANEIVTTVLQGLYAISNHNLAYGIKFSHLDGHKLSQGNTGTGSLAKTQGCFYLENVSSQLEQIFPKDGIFKKIFDKWQAETNDMESEKCELRMIAENVLTKISMKAKELGYSLSFLNSPHLEGCENRFHNSFKEIFTRSEDTKAQINMFGKEIIEMLFEKLQLCFLSQMPTPDSKETLARRKQHVATKSKYSFPTKDILSSVPIYNMKTKDHMSLGSSKQIVREIVERIFKMFESFVDVQFKHISKYEFSEIVKMPIENVFSVQQRLLSKTMLPKLQPLKMFSDESKSSTIFSKENTQNAILRIHSFHSDLHTYAVNIVSDMLGIIKSKIDKEISQVEPSSISILNENIVASEIIGTLIDQCTYFNESLIKNLPMDSSFQGVENIYIVNQVELATDMKMPMSKEVSLGNNPPQISVPGLVFYSIEDVKKRYRASSNVSSYARDTIKSTESMERPDSENTPLCPRNKVKDYSPTESNFSHFDQAMEGHSSHPAGSVLQKLIKKANESTQEELKQVLSFIEMGKGENPSVFHYETLKPVVEPDLTQTTVSPLKICLAAENIVNTVLSSYGFPSQPHINESVETMKPFFISRQNPTGQEKEEKRLLGMCDKRISCIPEEEEKPEVSRGDCFLLQKWENKRYPKIKALKELEVIAFADYELGPNEINLVARHVTTCVIIHFKNFKTRVPNEEKASIVSTVSKKKYKSKQPLRSIYNDSSLYQFCDHLTESVICHLISSISDSTNDGRGKDKARENQNAAFNKIISIDSQVFENRSIAIGELALRISETITEILFNGNIIEPDITQQMLSLKTQYIYCPGVAAADFDNLFQDLLIGVIHVLSQEIGIAHHLESNRKNTSFPMLRSNSVPICNKTNTMERQIGCRDLESSTHQIDHLIQKNKLHYLAYKLDNLVGSLQTCESKEVVNKVFNIVLDLFLPDEHPREAMDSDQKARTFFSFSNDQRSNSVLGKNLGLTPKSVFLLNIVCEKLITTLLEKFTNTLFLDNGPLSDEISAEEHHLLKMFQSVKDKEFNYCKGEMDCEQLQGDCMSDLVENLAEMDQDLLSSDSLLTIISHSLVKSLMDKLCHSMQLSQSPPFANNQLKYRTREMQSSFLKSKRPELAELRQGFSGYMSYDSNNLTGSLKNPSVISSKIQAPFGKKCSVNCSSVSTLERQRTKDMDTIAIHNKLYMGAIDTGVYSATFLEEIISELFFNLSTSLWGKNENVIEAQLNEMNTLFVNNVVNEFNNAQVTVLRNAEERLCFPPVHKETVSRIVDSIYYDVFQNYKLKVFCGGNLALDTTSITQQITNGILLEILDYQLPPCFRAKLTPNSYYPLEAEIILRKLQNKLREFTSKPKSPTGYSTMLSHSFLEDIIRRLLSQLISPPNKACSLGKKYFMSSDFNEMSTCIVNKVISAISKHKICFTIYDNQHLHTEKNLQKMVDSVYGNIMQTSESPVSIQKSIVSRKPIMIDRIASFIIQEIIENHLQPFLCEEGLPHPNTPLDAMSNMVHQVPSEVTEAHRHHTALPLGIYRDTYVREIVARLLSKIFSSKHNTEIELENMTQKIVNSINNYFDKAKIHILCDDKEQSYSSVDTDIMDELITSVCRNVLKQHGLDPEFDKESEDSDIFVEKITNLIVAAISDYLLHPLFSGDGTSSYSISTAENIVQDVISNISKSTKPSQSLSPYKTLLPYTFLEDMIRVLLSRIFSSASNFVPDRETLKDRSRVNFNEIASDIITDIRMKICQHKIRFSKDEEETKFVYSEDDVQHLVDSVFKNILQNSESQESVEQNITSSNDVLIERFAGFIIKHICQQHLQPFVDGKSLPSSYTSLDNERRQWFYASVYSSTLLEDVVSGVLSKVFHRVLGIVQTKSVRDSEDELFDKAENLIHLIAEEFSKAQVTILENAEEQLCLPPVERDVVKNIIDMVYSKFLQEYEMEIMPNNDFLNDLKTLAARITKIILAETFDFQIHPNLIGKLPFKSHSKLNTNVLTKRVQCAITKSRSQRQVSTMYTTKLSHTHIEKIITQLISQMNPLASSAECPDTSQSDLSNTVIKLINEIMSIISKHAICIMKHGNEKQSMISEKDMQSMVDSIYADLSYSNLYQSLTKDKKGISNIPVSKIASFIIKEIFNHHLQSFLSGDKTSLSAVVDQNYKQKAKDPKQRELSFIVNSAVFLEEVISELLCKLLYAFSHNVLAAENPDTVKAKITGIVTALVKSIVLEFTTSEILVADYIDDDVCFTEGYKEMVQKMVNLIYEKILDEYESLIQVYRAIQSDTVCFGRKIYHLLLEEIYDYQVQSLVSGELVFSSYSYPQADKIIRNVLNVIMKDSHTLPSCITVLPHSLLEDIINKLLVHIFPSADTESELKEEEALPDYEFMNTVSKLTDEIIKEISEHEIRLATAEENAESMQLEMIEKLVDSICNNIFKKSEFQADMQKDAGKIGGSFLSKIAGFIMKEIMDHHLQPFLHGEESSSKDYDHVSILTKPDKEKTQTSLYSARFLEDVIVDLVHKFYSLPSITEDSKKKMPGTDVVDLAIKFANSLIREFRKNEIRVLPNAEGMCSFPAVGKESVDKISNFVYDQFIAKYKSNEMQTDDKSNIVIEMIAALAQKAISAFKIQPLFSGDWSSTFFSFLNPDNITQRIQHLPQKTSTEINRCLKGNQVTLPEQSYKHTSLTLDWKNLLGTLEIDRGKMNRKKSFQTETSIKKGKVQDPEVTSITGIMKYNTVNLLSGSAAGVANKKKENENKMGNTIQINNENVSKVTSPTTSVKSKDTQKPDLRVTLKNNEIEKKSKLASKEEERQGNEIHTQIPVATDDAEDEEEIPGPDFEMNNEKKIDNTRENSFKKEDNPIQLSSLTYKVRNTGTTTGKTEKRVTQKPNIEERKEPPPLVDINEQYPDYEHVQNITENIYDNILGYSQESSHYSNLQSPSSDTAFHVIQEVGKDFAKSVTTKYPSLSINKNLPAKEKKEEKETEKERERERENKREKQREREEKQETEKVKVKGIKNEPSKPYHPQYPSKSKPGIFPAKFLEDVITEMVNKLIFSTSPETQTYDRYQNVSDDENQAELYDTAMKLIDSLLKEFSKAQIKVFRPDKENQFFPPVEKESAIPNVPPRHKESTTDEASPSIKKITVDNMPHMHKVTKNPSLNKIPFLDKIPAIDKTLVNKVVHSSLCNILKEYRSQDSICKNIKSNGENLARRLTSAVINEIFQHRLNLLFSDEVPASACLPLESKDVVIKVRRVAQAASKECQTSSPYTILLPHEFLENVISALLSKIFSTVSKNKAEIAEGKWLTELDFLQMKLLSTVTTEISKDKDLVIQYVESLHPNDDEIIQLVAHSIYNNLFSQFGTQEVIQNCVASGCVIVSKTIVDLVLREVAGNQLQNYFSGGLTPHQCAEVDSVVENILKDVIQTIGAPQPQPSHAHLLPYNIIEETAVKFLSKLLSMFPKVDKERTKSLETEMQKITSKILNSIQEFIARSKIKLIPPAKKLSAISLSDNESIDKVVNSVYTSVLKHSGSYTRIFKDLMGKSNVLSDIIGFLMVKELSNSEFKPQVEEEVSSSELVLEAVKIMEKVVKIVDEFKSLKKFSSKKNSMLDAIFLEEALALFLAKLVQLPSASSKDGKNLSKPELNKIASQLTKSVTAEICKSNISLVATDPEEQFLNPESIEMISQVIDSVYSNVLQQSGTHEDLYYDIKGTNRVFPKKVASLIINGVSSFLLDTDDSKYSNVDLFGDLDLDRIVQKAQEHAVQMIPDREKEESDQDLVGEMPIKIVPHVGNKPIKVDPDIISEHLAVISIKTQPLEELKTECLRKTGHSITKVRRASISGKSYSSSDTSNVGKMKKERRTSLNTMGQLDVKPLEVVCRNSFQNVRKPDIMKVELLKDVQSKKDLIIRLVAHDIEEESQSNIDEGLMFEEDEVVLGEVVPECLTDQVKATTKPIESTDVSPKPTASTKSLKKFLSLSKCCQTTSSTIIESVETTSNHIKEPKEKEVKKAVAELDMATCSTITPVTDSSWEKKLSHKKEELNVITEPTHYFIHRMMSSSSYNQEDLISSASEPEDCTPDTCATILEESSQEQKPEYSDSIKVTNIFEGNKNIRGGANTSKEAISETPTPSISQQGSKMLAKVSSALSMVFSRTNTNISKSSSPPHQEEH
ncbi:fibrous sheath interacting protein 2 [Rhinolophus ferrumequinum]|uniref:Fibrous sheath interacting protein 2 n=1 Tax=Rhinolophus ferrumequinum TaxID=59479 RepID=A0A7J7YHY9_RHIFE|nr:fibrous sheath interacting protein 2 [Rhinolophus ferrumequinum]